MKSLWKDSDSGSDPLSHEVYISHLLGAEKDLVLHGGGNTSVKVTEIDHAMREIRVLRVKGSGSDLSTMTARGFTGLRMDDMLLAKTIDKMDDIKMAEYLQRSMINSAEAAPSVESFLHAFIDFTYVNHSHSDAILSITNTELSNDEIEKILGDVVVLPYVPPGFKLAKEVLKVSDKLKKSKGLVLRSHGLFTYSNDPRESYENHIDLVTKAEEYCLSRTGGKLFTRQFESIKLDEETFLPVLRGLLSREKKKILVTNKTQEAIEIANSDEAEEICSYGPATPDMLIRTKFDFLYLREPEKAAELVESFRSNYMNEHSLYVKGYPMHDPFPAVIVVRGYGIISAGISHKEASIIMDQAIHSFKVNGTARKLGKHKFLTKKEAYEMEYWPLEEAKLKKFKPRKLEGTVAVVTGAASGIGLEVFRTLSKAGSHVVAMDVSREIDQVSKAVMSETGIINLPLCLDISDNSQTSSSFLKVLETFGGVDIVFNNAGILKTAPLESIKIEDLDLSYKVNAKGTFLITQNAFKIMKKQGIGGNFVFNITKNLTHPGPEMTMYGSTKAFAAHLSHYVAKEGGKYKIRSNIINPDKIFKGSKIWEGGVLESRAKAKGQTVEEYKTQNLLGIEVLPEHVAGVVMALIDNDSFGATTDCMIPVDGGIK